MDLDEQVDLELLLMDLPALPCEAESHSEPEHVEWHDEGPGTFYMRLNHDCIKRSKGEVYPVCSRYADHIRSFLFYTYVNCLKCSTRFDPKEWGEIVGPVGR